MPTPKTLSATPDDNADAAPDAVSGTSPDFLPEGADTPTGDDGLALNPREDSRASLLWQKFVVGLMRGATGPVRALPPNLARRFGTAVGTLGYHVAARPRKISVRNLRLAHGDALTPGEREGRTRAVFQHFGRCVVDFLRADALTRAQLDARVTCEGYEHVERAFGLGKGVIFVTGHVGNWEMLGRWGALIKGLPLTVVAKDPKRPELAALVRRFREGAGLSVLSRGESARGILKVLRVGSSRVDLQACKLEYSIVSPK